MGNSQEGGEGKKKKKTSEVEGHRNQMQWTFSASS